MSQRIYFDESGFTGNNLLDQNQPFFSYASVATDEKESKEFIDYLIEKYGINSGELKGSTLINSKKYQHAVDEILTHFKGKMRVTISEKKYALSGKFFEYIFEPILADKSSLFYLNNFHRFISNYLYIELCAKTEVAEQIHIQFESVMRGKSEIIQFMNESNTSDHSPVIRDILDFAICNKEIIQQELDSLEGTGVDKWILDLTTTSLYNLLADWGTRYPVLTAICDSSKPLTSNLDAFDSMIGITEQKYQELRGIKFPINFNLNEKIIQSDSKSTYGIQIADVVAATSVYVLNNKKNNEKFHSKWLEHFESSIFYWQTCVVPSLEHIDATSLESVRNRYLLNEITNRSKKGESVLHNIEHEFMRITKTLLLYGGFTK
ncbi:DUF3800 domain-containing protein [Rahnella sp. R3(2024)]|uniref:DUF3800 domain-containing protein n=1 Tax=Rahnella sp. R3(2024) TaxID=3163550 RepID=UPI0036E3D237